MDGAWSHLAFAQDRHLHFPLLSDFEPKGQVARQYGVYLDDVGESGRALFVIDKEGVIRWSYGSPVGVNPGADGILRRWRRWRPKEWATSMNESGSHLILPVGRARPHPGTGGCAA